MSRETLDWLNENTLIGFTDKRGHAWHYRKGADNHYAGAAPVADVEKRLFDWTAEERPLYVGLDNPVPEGQELLFPIPGRKAIVRSDTGHVMGIFADGYRPHQYRQWLLDNVSQILDDGLSIGSAGLLRGGAVAWVSVEVPENITTPEGVTFRPNLLATTSFDGSVATTYKRVVTNVVCDNTMRVGLNEKGQERKVRHSSRSMGKLAEVRDALGIIHAVADDFAREVKELCELDFTDRQFGALLAQEFPYPDATADMKPSAYDAAVTRADNRRVRLERLWLHDDRVTPWRGTAFGAWQAFNTYAQHENTMQKGTVRPERNMVRVISGESGKADADVLGKIMALTS